MQDWHGTPEDAQEALVHTENPRESTVSQLVTVGESYNGQHHTANFISNLIMGRCLIYESLGMCYCVCLPGCHRAVEMCCVIAVYHLSPHLNLHFHIPGGWYWS